MVLQISKMDFGTSMKDTVRLLTHAQNHILFSKQIIKIVSQNLVLILIFSQLHLMSIEDNQKIHTLVRFCQASFAFGTLQVSSSSFEVNVSSERV